MKHFILSIMLLLPLFVSAQNTTDSLSKQTTPIDTLLMEMCAELDDIRLSLTVKERYKLYPTENIYTLLQLDTKTGRIEQVQWSLDSDKEFTTNINSSDLSLDTGSNTFELYPTKNMYQFILIDKTNGRKWHVQWGMESSKRWIRRIY